MIDLSYFSLGILLWLGSCGFLITLRRDNNNSSSSKKIPSFDSSFRDSTKIQKLEKQLEIKINNLAFATEKIKALQEELQTVSDRLEYNQDKYKKSEQESKTKVDNLENQIERLEKKCLELNQEIENLPIKLIRDWQQKSFESLQTLLANYPTAKIMVKLKPELPAKNVITLLKPLDKVLIQWGIESIGKPWEKVSYNPQIHYSDEENLIPNEMVYIRFVGYRQQEKILLPAKVSRTLPGEKKSQ
ncbi:hypothetical protein [Geminocystis sp. NIES-3709]|uniref:hypothetical protein n=1 Tax=Geminocystis sp. NIES-3709 TaxID=1617448 RepID=UPI0005FC68D6|nr:hypothetical protein [Geminocystis sp. NIES-3709]BAQ64470.1 hypothetical protein GM3709_1235 [Geminocystis sp. NIES-3709]